MRTYKEIVKNYILIYSKPTKIYFASKLFYVDIMKFIFDVTVDTLVFDNTLPNSVSIRDFSPLETCVARCT